VCRGAGQVGGVCADYADADVGRVCQKVFLGDGWAGYADSQSRVSEVLGEGGLNRQ